MLACYLNDLWVNSFNKGINRNTNVSIVRHGYIPLVSRASEIRFFEGQYKTLLYALATFLY